MILTPEVRSRDPGERRGIGEKETLKILRIYNA